MPDKEPQYVGKRFIPNVLRFFFAWRKAAEGVTGVRKQLSRCLLLTASGDSSAPGLHFHLSTQGKLPHVVGLPDR